MLSLRTRLFIIISLIVLVILAISLLLLLSSKKKNQAEQFGLSAGTLEPSALGGEGIDTTGLGILGGTALPARREPPTVIETEQNGVKQLAKVFVERYHTYSSDNDFQNIKEVQSLVTPALWKRISSKIGSAPAGSFVGVTTEVLSAELALWNPPQATVNFKVIKTTEQKGKIVQAYQNLKVEMMKVDEAWLVNSFAGQK